jgi:hypothetical protein
MDGTYGPEKFAHARLTLLVLILAGLADQMETPCGNRKKALQDRLSKQSLASSADAANPTASQTTQPKYPAPRGALPVPLAYTFHRYNGRYRRPSPAAPLPRSIRRFRCGRSRRLGHTGRGASDPPTARQLAKNRRGISTALVDKKT